MIKIGNYEWLVFLLLIIGFGIFVFAAWTTMCLVCEQEELKKEKEFAKKIAMTLATWFMFFAYIIGGALVIDNKYENTFNIIKNLEIQEVCHEEKSSSKYGYFSDAEGKIYKIELSGLPITIETNINTTDYKMIVEEDKATIISPYTRDSLHYAKTQKYFFIFNPSTGTVLTILVALILVLMVWLLIMGFSALWVYNTFEDLPYKLYYICGILSVVFIIWCGFYSYEYNKEKRQENIEILKQMDVILKDDEKLYAIDENGILYKFYETEISEDYKYIIDMKEFLILDEDLHIPFQHLE